MLEKQWNSGGKFLSLNFKEFLGEILKYSQNLDKWLNIPGNVSTKLVQSGKPQRVRKFLISLGKLREFQNCSKVGEFLKNIQK